MKNWSKPSYQTIGVKLTAGGFNKQDKDGVTLNVTNPQGQLVGTILGTSGAVKP